MVVDSPRHLTIRNTRRIVTAAQTAHGLPLSFEEVPANSVATVQSAATATATTTDDVREFSLAFEAAVPTAADVVSGASDSDKLNAKLKPGQEQIFSYWTPGLKAGKQHNIRVTQTIEGHKPEDKPLQLESIKSFLVEAPQFSLPGDAIHSIYPPQVIEKMLESCLISFSPILTCPGTESGAPKPKSMMRRPATALVQKCPG